MFEDVLVPIAPTAFKADGKWHVVYELHLNNMDRWQHQLTKVEAISGDAAARTLVAYSGAELDAVLARPGHPGATEKSKVEPGAMAIIYIWATFDTLEAVPTTVRQKLTVKVGTYPEELSIVTAPIPVGRGAVAISFPFGGDHWLAANGPSNTSGHRRALIPIDGHAAIAQRFAIDWVRLRDDGKTFQGDEKDNKNYLAYGTEALAVADGVVTEMKGWDTGEYSWREFARSTDHLGDGWRKPCDFGHRRRALCVLRALAAWLAAGKARRQSAARSGGRSRWQFRKFDGAAFAFSYRECEFPARGRRPAVRAAVV